VKAQVGEQKERVLVIKLGALGDFVQALGPMQAIRAHHPKAAITLLTTPPFAGLARASKLFDDIWTDGRPGQFLQLLALLRRLSRARFRWVYDLQTQSRSNWYFYLLWPKPLWSGVALGASHRHVNPARAMMHVADAQREQLALAGISTVAAADLSFLDADISSLVPGKEFVLMVPGGSAHRPEKRWPWENYAALARHLLAGKIRPIFIGGAGEAGLGRAIAARAPGSIDLCGRTDFAELASLARRACAAVGNDTGPMHIIARVDCPTIVLFSQASDPALCAPKGNNVCVIRRPELNQLRVAEVVLALEAFLPQTARKIVHP
jgi:ADP-heptose:LPS heptosyltransferase